MDSLISRLEAVTFKIAGGGGGGDGELPISVSEWNSFYTSSVQPFIDACNSIEETKKIGTATETAMRHTAVVLEAATVCAKPADGDFVQFLDPIVKVISAAQNCDNRSTAFNQEKAFAEAISCLNWLMAAASKPVIMGQLEAAEFYLSKVLVSSRDAESPKKENLRAFVANIKKMLTDMAEYGNNFHKTGLMWKHGGAAVGSFKPGAKPASTGESKSSPEDKLANCIAALEGYAAKKGGAGGDDEEAACVVGFNDFYTTAVQPFVDACNALAGTKRLGAWAEQSFQHLGVIMKATTTSKKPTPEALMTFLGPIATAIGAAMNLNPRNNDEFFGHETSFKEGLQSLNWVCMEGLPRPFIHGQLDAADFYLSKVLTAARDKDDATKKAYQTYVKTFKELIEGQEKYAVEFFKTGLTWNPKGGELGSAPAAAVKPAEKPAAAAAATATAAPGTAKPNPLAGLGSALAGAKKPAVTTPAGPTQGKIDTSQNSKIFVEKFDSKLQKEPVVVKVSGDDGVKTGVFIGNCKGPDLCIKIEGKCKNITVSNCHQCGIIFDNCVTTVEVIGSKRCQLQALECAGSYIIDKCDRTQLFLADASVSDKVVVYSAQSTSTNVSYSVGDGDDDHKEFSIPDQMISTFKKATDPHHDVVIPDAE